VQYVQVATSTSGGTIVTSGANRYHIFTGNSNLVVSAPAPSSANALIIGGGGGGGSSHGGGGGAGEVVYTSASISNTTYAIVVGTGGAIATNGVASSAFSISANYGGKGGGNTSGSNASAGGSGGGGTSFGQGVVNIGNCDSAVNINLESNYTDGDFMMNAIVLSALDGGCNGQNLVAVLNVKSSGSKYGTSTNYALGDIIECTMTLALDANSANNTIALTYSDCYNKTQRVKPFMLYDLSARDLSETSGAVAVQIS
jgi:hypothetical protein